MQLVSAKLVYISSLLGQEQSISNGRVVKRRAPRTVRPLVGGPKHPQKQAMIAFTQSNPASVFGPYAYSGDHVYAMKMRGVIYFD